MEDIKGADEAEEEKDLVGVGGRSFVTIAKRQDTTCRSVRIKHTLHINNALSLTTQSKNILC